MQAGAASGNNENKTRLDTSITGSFQDFNSLSKIGKVLVQPTEKRSSKSSPEPGTVFLLGAGMAGVILITRRRRKR
ncbi:PEP-CTERM sorting domain-containing protein [Desulfopila inferna]|uniref:PEP-CTERM sorting domain-containing protein n=1 Tax=Desulfopila inferna TaxID=468528 RepID=UPI00338E90B5